MIDIGPQLDEIMKHDVPSFYAFLILEGDLNESVRKSNVSTESLYDAKSCILSDAD